MSASGGWDRWEKDVFRGDLVVLFGRGVHVETVRDMDRDARLVRTDGGNTSSGPGGSQSNGGGSFPRWRSIDDVHGFALVDYPGTGATITQLDVARPVVVEYEEIGPASDDILMVNPGVRERLTAIDGAAE